MNQAEFMAAYNKRAEEIGHGVLILGVTSEGASAASVSCGEDVSLVIGPPDNVTYCQVICPLLPDKAPWGLCAYSTALDVMTRCSPQVRNGWLNRLGLFNGKLAKAHNMDTKARDYMLSIRTHNPGKNLMSYIIKPLKTMDNPRRGVTDEELHNTAGGQPDHHG